MMRLGPKQTEIMKVLWEHGRCNAKEITDHLNDRGQDIAHSTVQTQLRLLMKKDAVDHTREHRTFYFTAAVDQSATALEATEDLLDRMFGGSAAAMVSHLMDQRSLSRKEINAIRKLIETHEGAPPKKRGRK